MKRIYAKYCIPHDVTPSDIIWFQLTFSTRAELEIMNLYSSINAVDNNACFHFDDDVLIFLIKFPHAYLIEYNEMHDDY